MIWDKPPLFFANTSRFSDKPSPADCHCLSRQKKRKPSPAARKSSATAYDFLAAGDGLALNRLAWQKTAAA